MNRPWCWVVSPILAGFACVHGFTLAWGSDIRLVANAEGMPTAALKVGVTIRADILVPIFRGELLLAVDTKSLLVGHRCQLLSISC